MCRRRLRRRSERRRLRRTSTLTRRMCSVRFFPRPLTAAGSNFLASKGAALYGAGITRGFRTKDIRVQDLTPYGIDVAYQSDITSPGTPTVALRPRQTLTDLHFAGAEARTITTHLFPAFSKTGNKKMLTMRKTKDFDLEFSYRKTDSPSCVPLSFSPRPMH